jgi:hypothetical protein
MIGSLGGAPRSGETGQLPFPADVWICSQSTGSSPPPRPEADSKQAGARSVGGSPGTSAGAPELSLAGAAGSLGRPGVLCPNL